MKQRTARLVTTLMFTVGAVASTLWLVRPHQPQAKPQTRATSQGEGKRPAEPVVQANEFPKLYPVRVNGRTGFIDNTGKIAIKPQFPPLYIWGDFKDGMARTSVSRQERPGYCCLFGFINAAGWEVVEPQYWEVEDFSEGLAAVLMGDRWGYIDREGRTTLGPRWIAAQSFSEGLAGVCEEGGDCGYIDKAGAWAIRGEHINLISHFSEGLAPNMIDARSFKFVYINRTGHTVIEGPFDEARHFSGGLALVRFNGRWFHIDKTGREVQKPERIRSFMQNGKIGFMDAAGKVIMEPQIELAFEFSEGLAPVRVKGKWGYMDEGGRMVIKPRFYEAYKFSGGIAKVMPAFGWMGYIDKTGKYVWRPSR